MNSKIKPGKRLFDAYTNSPPPPQDAKKRKTEQTTEAFTYDRNNDIRTKKITPLCPEAPSITGYEGFNDFFLNHIVPHLNLLSLKALRITCIYFWNMLSTSIFLQKNIFIHSNKSNDFFDKTFSSIRIFTLPIQISIRFKIETSWQTNLTLLPTLSQIEKLFINNNARNKISTIELDFNDKGLAHTPSHALACFDDNESQKAKNFTAYIDKVKKISFYNLYLFLSHFEMIARCFSNLTHLIIKDCVISTPSQNPTGGLPTEMILSLSHFINIFKNCQLVVIEHMLSPSTKQLDNPESTSEENDNQTTSLASTPIMKTLTHFSWNTHGDCHLSSNDLKTISYMVSLQSLKLGLHTVENKTTSNNLPTPEKIFSSVLQLPKLKEFTLETKGFSTELFPGFVTNFLQSIYNRNPKTSSLTNVQWKNLHSDKAKANNILTMIENYIKGNKRPDGTPATIMQLDNIEAVKVPVWHYRDIIIV